ncbi:hypothetical protein [Bacteroides pyogenes]|uniref:hypothetical protein n=1 Tax=Bacteroides pyogenes TaxID=310300 RepID=UPI001F33DD19|nr:hypothetical protein [Bacteroides pyogenes]MCE9106561.1 hypothetical protein [Bacteroides pyogenes]
MELKIYNQSGELKLTVSSSSSSTWNQELMVENALSVSFTHTAYVPLAVNDYAMLEGVKFSVKKEYKPKQKNRQTYSYSVKLYAPIHDAEQVKYLYLTDGEYNPQFSLDGTPREHLQKWTDNMNRISGGPQWSVGDVIITSRKTIDYNNTSCWEALGKMADAFDTEWWVDGYVINLSRCEHGQRIPLGYLKGLTSFTQIENSDNVKFFTRLIPLGSTRNIDRTRYGFSRLQLPGREKYIDRNTQYGLYEHVEEAAFADIFPHYTGTVTAVRSVQRKDNNGKPFTIYYFKDSGMAFDPNIYELPALKKRVSFQSGDLNGHGSDENGTYYFEVNWNSATKEWEIITIFPDETRQLPGGNLIPRVGDKYIPWNIQMPEDYERQAEQDYLAAVNDYLEKHSEDASKYGGDTDYIYIEENGVPLAIGQSVRLLSDEYFTSGYRHSRMTKVVRKLDNLNMATIECADSVGKGWKRQVDSSLSQLKYVLERQQKETAIDILKSWDEREINDYRVFSALRALKELESRLSRRGDDTAAGLITFLKGLQFGEFAPGLSGYGGKIDGSGNAELESLVVRSFIESSELRYNRVKFIHGEEWNAKGGGIIESVDPAAKTFKLKLEPGEYPSVAFDDLCKAKYNTGTGYRTAFFRIVSVSPDGTVNYELRPGYDVHPQPTMHFVAFGNRTDKTRQASAYSTTSYTRYLSGVNDWDIRSENIAMQFGDLSNLSVYGLQLEGYSAYLSNVYFTGLIVQLQGIVREEIGRQLPGEVQKQIPVLWDLPVFNLIAGAPLDVNTNELLSGRGDGSIDVEVRFFRNGDDVTATMRRSSLRLFELRRVHAIGYDDNGVPDAQWNEANKGKDVFRLTPGDVMYSCGLEVSFDDAVLESEFQKLK